MTQVNILSGAPTNQNTAAFLAPIVWNHGLLRDLGVHVNVYYDRCPNIFECDVLAINGKYWSGAWSVRRDEALDWTAKASGQVARVIYFDRISSPGQVIPELFPVVHRYLKPALYADRNHYAGRVYGGRLFADYYHHKYGITDHDSTTIQPLDADAIGKLGVAWNTGLANYGMFGPRLAAQYGRIPWRGLFRPVSRYWKPAVSRPVGISCRMGLNYKYETVAFQRRQIASLLAEHNNTKRVGKVRYFRELTNSFAVTSPFGFSEINYKDFESFIAGAVLVKPNMSHLDTWPNYYEEGQTYVAHRWDMSDVVELVQQINGDRGAFIAIATEGQRRYRHHTLERDGREAFASRFLQLVLA